VFGADPTPVPLLPFAAAALEPYAPDAVTAADVRNEPGTYRARAAVLRAVGLLRDTPAPGHPRGKGFPLRIDAVVTNQTRDEWAAAQEVVAVTTVALEEVLDELAAAGRNPDASRRWRAHHDLVTAQVRARLVLLHEYNRSLASARNDALPPLPDGAGGWRLVPAGKVQSRLEVKKLAEVAADGLRAVARTHAGTPWAALAERDLRAPLGMAWEVVPGK
jgi:hypothetical protein